MNVNEFKQGFDQLVRAFSVTKAEDKAEIYFQELKSIPQKPWDTLVTAWIRKGHKFPTIADLLEVWRAIEPHKPDSMAHGCQDCDGRGGVSLAGRIFKARCRHGEEFCPPGVMLIPDSEEEKQRVVARFEREDWQLYGHAL